MSDEGLLARESKDRGYVVRKTHRVGHAIIWAPAHTEGHSKDIILAAIASTSETAIFHVLAVIITTILLVYAQHVKFTNW